MNFENRRIVKYCVSIVLETSADRNCMYRFLERSNRNKWKDAERSSNQSANISTHSTNM